MKIFVGYGYHPRDKWVEELVFPLIEAFGDTPVTGREISGQNLDDGVRGRIKECDALMGFLTRRDPVQNGIWTTHDWVKQEIATADALNPKIPFVEIREAGIDPQPGMAGGKSHILYDETQSARCLLRLAQTISRWHSELRVCVFELAPVQLINEISPRLGDANLQCSFQLLNANTGNEGGPIATNIIQLREGLFVYLKNVPSDWFILVRVRVSFGNQFLWVSDYQKADARIVSLKKQTI
jgi:hypothetical protein